MKEIKEYNQDKLPEKVNEISYLRYDYNDKEFYYLNNYNDKVFVNFLGIKSVYNKY